ncbi:MAG: biotin/lipoyl-containing protein [Chloroflexota bacterium]
MRYMTTIGEREFVIEILDEQHISVDGKVFTVDFDSVGDQPVYSLLVDGRSFEAYVYPGEEDWQVLLHGRSYTARVEDERDRRLRIASGAGVGAEADFQLKSPMPGLVVAVPVSEGQEVRQGEVLVVLESMKMQNELKSPRPGVVARLRVQTGDHVEQNQVLLTVASLSGAGADLGKKEE